MTASTLASGSGRGRSVRSHTDPHVWPFSGVGRIWLRAARVGVSVVTLPPGTTAASAADVSLVSKLRSSGPVRDARWHRPARRRPTRTVDGGDRAGRRGARSVDRNRWVRWRSGQTGLRGGWGVRPWSDAGMSRVTLLVGGAVRSWGGGQCSPRSSLRWPGRSFPQVGMIRSPRRTCCELRRRWALSPLVRRGVCRMAIVVRTVRRSCRAGCGRHADRAAATAVQPFGAGAALNIADRAGSIGRTGLSLAVAPYRRPTVPVATRRADRWR